MPRPAADETRDAQALSQERSPGSAEADAVPPDPKRSQRLESGRRFSIEAARLCADRRCRNVRVLDVSGLSPICDYFVLATGASERQMGTVARDVEELADGFDLRPLQSTRRGEPNERWVAIDLVDVIVHVFSEEARLFYDLDNLWGDAREIHWSAGRELPSA